MLYLASRPCPSAIFHVVHERMRYFNWFIVFPFFTFLNKLVSASVSVTSWWFQFCVSSGNGI